MLACGCTPDASGFGWCSECVRKLRNKIWRKMSEEKKSYDRTFAPEESKILDDEYDREYNTGCSCHINPPCSYCTSSKEEEEDGNGRTDGVIGNAGYSG